MSEGLADRSFGGRGPRSLVWGFGRRACFMAHCGVRVGCQTGFIKVKEHLSRFCGVHG